MLHLPDGNHRDAFLKTPSGDSVELAAEPLLDGVMFRSTRTVLPGHYELQLGLSGDTIPFHIQRSLHESDLRDLSDDDRSLLKATAGLTQNLLSTGMAGHSHRDPVWPILLMLLIAFMSAELVLSESLPASDLERIPFPKHRNQSHRWPCLLYQCL